MPEIAARRGPRPLWRPQISATSALLGLWLLGLTLTSGGAVWALWLWPGQMLPAFLLWTYCVPVGAPLFLLTWYLLRARTTSGHAPFLALAGTWIGVALGVSLPLPGRAFVEANAFSATLCALLPAISSALLVVIVARARRRVAEAASATLSRAT